MVPHGLILKESEATGIRKVLIYLKGIWYVILNKIWVWMLVGERFLGKSQTHMHELEVDPGG